MSIIRDSLIELFRKDRSVGINVALKMFGEDGGKGSGNFGHSGRPGKRGGSAKRGGSGGVSGEKEKKIKEEREAFKKLSKEKKIEALHKVGQLPIDHSHFEEVTLQKYADKHGLTVDEYIDWRAARYFTMRKFQPEVEYKTPLKKKEAQ